jgi:hypothetical protein
MEFIARHRRLTWTSVLVLFLLAVWYFWPDRRLDQVKALQKELFSAESKKMAPEERKQKWQALRQATDRLSNEQKQTLSREREQRFEQELMRYAKLPKKEQLAYLDKQIDGMEKARKNFAKNPADKSKGKGKGGGPSFGKKGQSMSAADRDRARRQRLDNSTPEFRALMDRYRKDMQARMNARGIMASPWTRGA